MVATGSINRSHWGYRSQSAMRSSPSLLFVKRASKIEHCSNIHLNITIFTILYITYLISIYLDTVEAFCPKRCFCDEKQLEVTCHEAIGLLGVPITLNPQTKRIFIKNNNLTTFHNIEIYRDLEGLDLSHNNINLLNLEKLETNTHLQTVNASHNNISDIIDTGIKNSESSSMDKNIIPVLPTKRLNLRTLLLDHNSIRTINDLHFYRLPNLNYLDISYNKIEIIENFSFIGIRNLERLILRGNRIIQIPTVPISYLGYDVQTHTGITKLHPIDLKTLDLSYNPILTIQDGSFQSLQTLEKLNLDSCSIKYIEDEAFDRLISLQILSLDRNQLDLVPAKSLSHLTRLRVLRLNQNKFFDIPQFAFSNLVNLQDLQLNNQTLMTVRNGSFYGLFNLRRLEISSNKDLSLIERGSLANLANLIYLNLSSNALTSLSEDLTNSTNLSLLDVRNNPLNCLCSLRWLGQWLRRFDNKTIEYQSKSQYHDKHLLTDGDIEYAPLLNDSIFTRELVDLKCAKPAALANRLLINLHLEKLDCLEPTSELHVQIGVVTLLLIVILLLVACYIGFCLKAKDFLLVLKDNIFHRGRDNPMTPPFELDKPKVLNKNASTLFSIDTDAHMYDTNLSYGEVNEYSSTIYDDRHYQEPLSVRTYTDL